MKKSANLKGCRACIGIERVTGEREDALDGGISIQATPVWSSDPESGIKTQRKFICDVLFEWVINFK